MRSRVGLGTCRILALFGILLGALAAPGLGLGLGLASSPEDGAADQVQALALPGDMPALLDLSLSYRGEDIRLRLEHRSLRAQGFRLRAWADGVTRVIEAPEPASYRGVVEGEPGSSVGGALTPAGLRLTIFRSDGTTLRVEPLSLTVPSAAAGLHLITAASDWPEGRACGVSEPSAAGEPAPFSEAGASLAPASSGAGAAVEIGSDPRLSPGAEPAFCGRGTLSLAEIAFDVDQVYYRNLGSDLAAVTANVEAHLAAVDAFYTRDALITYVMTDLIVRTTDFYMPQPTTGSLLDLFRDEWNANQTGVTRDIAHLMTGQPAPGLAGLAYVGVVCNLSWCYGWSVDSSGVVGHEVGHNWSSGHCHDVAPCNNMCGACLYIGPNTKAIIESFRDSRSCLDTTAPAVAPAAPYATADTARITLDELALGLPVRIDALANDHDANCDAITIGSHDALSRLGGTVGLEPGAGPAGRDLLVYAPPCSPFSGADTFAYTVEDGAGGSSTATVSVVAESDALAAYWPMDEGAGVVAADAGAARHDATLQGGAAWGTGRVGGGLVLDGVDDHATIPALGLRGLPVTITGWVRRSGAQAAFSGILFSRAAGTVAGLHVGTANELRYSWQDSPSTWGVDSSLVLPDGAWAFVALVVEPDRATLYLDDGTWRSFVNVTPHGAQTFAGEVSLGRDPTGGRQFRGEIDEVRVHDAALSEAELMALRDISPRPEAPSPADGSFVSDPDVTLSWRSSAPEHDVYLGTDVESVRAATPASSEYRGRISGSSFDPPGLLLEGQAHAWRADPVVGGVAQEGPAWRFTVTGSDERLLGYWRFDEGAGTTSADASGGGRDANLVNGAAWGAGPHDGSLLLDGSNDQAIIPPLARPLDELTICAWMRTAGAPAPWAGIAFCRGGSTTAGLNFRDTNELGYHWDGGQWGWGSGLFVPADAWVFVALAVRPDSATIFLHDGTAWSSATHAAGHPAEAFDADLVLGRDPWGSPRSLAGELDDVRVFDRALTEAQLDVIRLQPARAMNPQPPDGATLLAAPPEIAWVPGAGVTRHDAYFGSDLDAVRAAGPGSPEHLGSPAAPLVPLAGLVPGTYYWRVDETGAAGQEPGEIWRFRIFGPAADALRVVKNAAGAPRLTWQGVEAAATHVVLRCDASPASCAPAPVDAVPAWQRAWDDAAATERLIFYQLAAEPCLP